MLDTSGLTDSLDQNIELVVCEIMRHTTAHRISKPELRIDLFLVYATQKFWVESNLFYSTDYTYGDVMFFVERYRQNITAALYAAKG